MSASMKYLIGCTITALALCFVQINGSSILIYGCLFVFIVLSAVAGMSDFTFPVLLFFLPWSPLLKPYPESFSFYTVCIMMICGLNFIKNNFRLNKYYVAVGVPIVLTTLISRYIDGSRIEAGYIIFVMLIFLFSQIKKEIGEKKYDFRDTVLFLSAGIVIAALCAQRFAAYQNIGQYITVDAYSTIVRLSGFYGDPNFYTAQITAAISGCLIILINKSMRKNVVIYSALTMLLIYCGFLSGSKSFILILVAIVAIWITALMIMKEKVAIKISIILGGILFAGYIVSSALFSDLLAVLNTRLSYGNTISDFTTGRTDLWIEYTLAILRDAKLFFFGQGYVATLITEKSSHSTPIQLVYQFGVLGAPLVITWMVLFFKDVYNGIPERKKDILNTLILLVGVFAPWFALDILFFDEFFLFTLYVFFGLRFIAVSENGGETTFETTRRKFIFKR